MLSYIIVFHFSNIFYACQIFITFFLISIRHLYKKMVDAKMKEWFAFVNPTMVSKARMGEATKENKSRVIAKQLMNSSRADYIFIPYNPE